ncbi:MAG TPA: N-acetylmuramoyl-L-alanine amidase [Acholeplasmataceae bacterium]|nr:N-acetylmuramoyl-L-alanine amidase [Acholeplasmataceae bacterium]
MRGLKFIVLFLVLFMFYGCKGEEPTWAISAEYFEYNMMVGEELDPNIEIHPYYKKQTLVLESADESIVMIENGLLKAVGIGRTEVRAYLEDYPDEHYLELTVIVGIADEHIAEYVLDWVKTQIGTEIDEPKTFPTTHPDYQVEIEYESDDPEVLTNTGIPYKKEFDVEVGLEITVRYKDYVATDVLDITVIGYAFSVIHNNFYQQLPLGRRIVKDATIRLDTIKTSYPTAVISWHSTNTAVFTNAGKYIQPLDDTVFQIVLTISFPERGLEHTYYETFTAVGMSIYDKAEIVEAWIYDQEYIPEFIGSDLELPSVYDAEFKVTLEWSSNKPEVITSAGKISLPNKNELVTLTCKVVSGKDQAILTFKAEVAARTFTDKWEAIEAFLGEIFLPEIKTQKYLVAGVAASFYKYNYGYLPFYIQEKSVVTPDLLPADHKFRPSPGQSYTRKYVVIHDTANNTAGAGVLMHSQFIKNTDRSSSSWHYTVDDTLIYQHIPDMEVAWHAGEADGNRYGIGIETCINPEADYTIVMQRTAKLTAELLAKYGLTLNDVKQHYDFTQKDCPRVMRTNKRWDEFLNLVSIEYMGLTRFADVKFEWESLSKSVMNDRGYIINHPGVETTVTYKVKVTYNNETREYTHSSKLLPPSWN